MKIGIAADHAGQQLKATLVSYLGAKGRDAYLAGYGRWLWQRRTAMFVSVLTPKPQARGDYIIGVGESHLSEQRERQESLIDRFGYRTHARSCAETLTIERVQVDGDIMHVHTDPLGAQSSEDVVPTGIKQGKFQLYDVQMVCVRHTIAHGQRRE